MSRKKSRMQKDTLKEIRAENTRSFIASQDRIKAEAQKAREEARK